MKANELRIGNYIKKQGIAKPFRVIIIDTTETSLNTKCEPIEITEEWLLKFGFNYLVDFSLQKNGFTICFEKQGNALLCYVESIGLNVWYVHQLQNLYFALTNQELTI